MSAWGDMPHLHTPNEIYAAAKIAMLNGNEPETKDDYAAIMNYLAHNLSPEIALSACLLLKKIYDMPLSDEFVTQIVKFQLKEHN